MSYRNRAWNGGGGTTTSGRKYTVPEPKNEANREGWDRLKEKYDTCTNDNLSLTYFRALKSLATCTEAITTYAEAKKLKGVGDKCANIICPMTNTSTSNNGGAPKVVAKPRKNAGKKKTAGSDDGDTSTQSTLLDGGFQAERVAKRPRTTKAGGNNNNDNELDGPSKKETDYRNAKQDAIQNWSHPFPEHNQDLEWKVLLLVDTREPKSQHILSKCTMSGIPAQERVLPIGDMTWVAQGLRREKGGKPTVEVELLLGTIIERKTVSDLAHSLFDKRYQEQRLRLKQSGASQLLYLIEGDIQKEAPASFPKERVQMALMETRVYLGFHILRTKHMDETVTTLKRIHRRILQRTFPDAFGLTSTSMDALPSFASPNANSRRGMQPLPVFNADPARNRGRRRQRRPESLVEMVMDTPPIPAFGEARFITYNELKCKVERDREAGTRTVGAIHSFMLRQVCGPEKVRGILHSYPTPAELLQAYDEVAGNPKQQSSLMADCSYVSDSKGGAASRKVGPKASKDMFVAYCTNPYSTATTSAIAKPGASVPVKIFQAETSATATSTCSTESISSGAGGSAGKRKASNTLLAVSRLTTWGQEAPYSQRLCASPPSSDSDFSSSLEQRKPKAASLPNKTATKKLCVDLLSSDDDEDGHDKLAAVGKSTKIQDEKENNAVNPTKPSKVTNCGSVSNRTVLSSKELVVLDDSSVDESDADLLAYRPTQRYLDIGLSSSSCDGKGGKQPSLDQDDDSLSIAVGATSTDAIEID